MDNSNKHNYGLSTKSAKVFIVSAAFIIIMIEANESPFWGLKHTQNMWNFAHVSGLVKMDVFYGFYQSRVENGSKGPPMNKLPAHRLRYPKTYKKSPHDLWPQPD